MKKKLSIKNALIIIVVLIVAVVACVFLFSGKSQTQQINSFEDCANAGYPIQETFPERCVTSDGAAFTKP